MSEVAQNEIDAKFLEYVIKGQYAEALNIAAQVTDIYIKDPETGSTFFHHAAASKTSAKFLKAMAEMRPDLNYRMRNKEDELGSDIAYSSKNPNLAQWFRDREYESPVFKPWHYMFMAVSNNDVKTLDEGLSRFGVKVKNSIGDTLLHHAAFHNAFDAASRLVVEPDIDHHAINELGFTPAKCCGIMSNVDAPEAQRLYQLLRPFHEAGRKDIENDIFLAAEMGDIERLDKLLKDIDVNIQDRKGFTPLHYAAITLSLKAIDRLLAEPGIDAQIRSHSGKTAVEVAAAFKKRPSRAVVQKLWPHCYPWLKIDPAWGLEQ